MNSAIDTAIRIKHRITFAIDDSPSRILFEPHIVFIDTVQNKEMLAGNRCGYEGSPSASYYWDILDLEAIKDVKVSLAKIKVDSEYESHRLRIDGKILASVQ